MRRGRIDVASECGNEIDLRRSAARDGKRGARANIRSSALSPHISLRRRRAAQSRSSTNAPKDRYFIFSLKSDRHAYVQCLFLPDEPRVLCEASSGYFLSKPGEPRSSWRVPPAGLAELGKLGFSTEDRDGNHQVMIDLGSKIDFVAIADLILSVIYHGYGARVGTPMQWTAPLVPRDDDSDQRCTPLG